MAFAVVPAFNERPYIQATVRGLLDTAGIEGVLVVDDGSRDGTAAAVASLEDPRVMFSRTRTNRGKGAALNHGMKLLNGRDIDIFVFCDADLGDTSREVRHLLEPILAGRAELTTALFPPGSGRGFGMVVRLARWGITRASGHLVRAPLSGQRAFTEDVWSTVGPCVQGFGVEPVFTARALKAGLRLQEVDTAMQHRVTGMSARHICHRLRQMWDVGRGLVRLFLSVEEVARLRDDG